MGYAEGARRHLRALVMDVMLAEGTVEDRTRLLGEWATDVAAFLKLVADDPDEQDGKVLAVFPYDLHPATPGAGGGGGQGSGDGG